MDIVAGDYLVQVIKPLAKMTKRSGCDADLGGFGGEFDLAAAGLSNCVLTCRTWGVGRKIKVKFVMASYLFIACSNHYVVDKVVLSICNHELELSDSWHHFEDHSPQTTFWMMHFIMVLDCT